VGVPCVWKDGFDIARTEAGAARVSSMAPHWRAMLRRERETVWWRLLSVMGVALSG
jgi:hypothetical protein